VWPDHETTIDLLGIKHLKDAVLDIVKNDTLLPATIGIFGDWGSGKSSLIKKGIIGTDTYLFEMIK
jgi:putative protein kinase ArgK-like GTPase of G3E family